jgi:intein-encoded DNA endonuclease-like protein
MKQLGKIPSKFSEFEKDENLAELIGVVLGDGHIRKYPRTEELSIFSNAKNKGFVNRYSDLILKIFNKQPAVTKHGDGCVRIRIYQKNIQKRLGVPYSPRGELRIEVPNWILKNKKYIVSYLRGLYEAEGCYCTHEKTSTFKMFFTNRNISMLNNVYELVKYLGFHPHRSLYQVQLSKKVEVHEFLRLIQFRVY